MTPLFETVRRSVARWQPALLLAALWIVFSAASPQFRRIETVLNVLEHASSTAILAIGMTFVLVAGGIDLSVGAVMLLASAVCGSLLGAGWPIALGVLAMVLIGMAWGVFNGMLVAQARLTPFIVTLSTLFLGRGLGLWITETRPIALPDEFRSLTTTAVAGVPASVVVMLACACGAHVALTQTWFGRRLFALGGDPQAAVRAGINDRRLGVAPYVICGGLAAVAAVIAVAELNTVSPTLGTGRELTAIAAAVLGGVSLFGGRGSVPGAVVGAVTIQCIYSGLSTLDADPQFNIDIDEYAYPLITAALVFSGVLIDSLRKQWVDRSQRRLIRPMDMSHRPAGSLSPATIQ
ncbi:MAG TPA: ABC transporter permease [Lacipirellulaceae bacterium]|nr:ABC transporter permease [Lacipirellulaceae bacterium]